MPKPKDITFAFPLKGINRNFAEADQIPRSAPDMLNVRPLDVFENRIRGGKRPGLQIEFTTRIGGTTKPVVAIDQVTIVETT